MTRWFYRQRKQGFEAQTNSRVCSVRPCLREKYSVTTQHFASITRFADTSWTEYKIKLFPFTSHTSLGISWKTKWFYETIVILHHLFSPAAKANLRVLALLGDILNILTSSICSSITPSLALWSRVVPLFFWFPPLCLACWSKMLIMSPARGVEPFLTSKWFRIFHFWKTFSQSTSPQQPLNHLSYQMHLSRNCHLSRFKIKHRRNCECCPLPHFIVLNSFMYA